MNAKVLAGIVLALVLALVGGFVLLGQSNGVTVAQATSTPVSTSAAPTKSVTPTVAATVTVAPTATPAPTVAPTVAPTPVPTNGTISGKVTDAKTGAPLGNFAVIVYNYADGMCPGVTSGSTLGRVVGLSQADGTFTTLAVAPGTYIVSITPRGSMAGQYGNWWWNNKNGCTGADQLKMSGNVGDINFVVPPSH